MGVPYRGACKWDFPHLGVEIVRESLVLVSAMLEVKLVIQFEQ